MIKLIYCVTKRADLSKDEFSKYWFENHAALMRRLAGTLGVVKYIQSHTLATPLNDELPQQRRMEAPYDGITEVWYESLEALEKKFMDPAFREARALLIQDEANFVDFSRSRVFFTDERVIIA